MSPVDPSIAVAASGRARRHTALDGVLLGGDATGIGSLPHRDALDAARFALGEYDVPAIPTLPRRSPAEGMIAQAVLGIEGVALGQYGSIAVDVRRLDPVAPVVTDFLQDSFTSFRVFLDEAVAVGWTGPVKWQFVGPVTLGVALTRAGVAVGTAFAVAVRAVRAHLLAIAHAVSTALPDSPQLVLLDEPWFGDVMSPGFPIAPDPAIDLLSGAMAAVEPMATVGVHCCAPVVDIASLLAAGPRILSIPVREDLADVAGYLVKFLDDGGRIAWGVVPTDGPIAVTIERPARQLAALWGTLVQRGGDPAVLRQRCLVTPHCGLGLHTPIVADRVCRLTREIGRRVHEGAIIGRG